MTNETKIQLNETYHVIQIRTKERVQLAFYKDDIHFHEELIGVQYPELNLEHETLSWLNCVLPRLTKYPELILAIINHTTPLTAFLAFTRKQLHDGCLYQLEPSRLTRIKASDTSQSFLLRGRPKTPPIETVMPYDQYREAFAQVFGAENLPEDEPEAVTFFWKQRRGDLVHQHIIEGRDFDGLSSETIEAMECLAQGWPLAFWL